MDSTGENKLRTTSWITEQVGVADALVAKYPPDNAFIINVAHDYSNLSADMWMPLQYEKIPQERLEILSDIIEGIVNRKKKVVIHCIAGIERSPLVVAWWLADKGHADNLSEAYNMVKAARPVTEDVRSWIV